MILAEKRCHSNICYYKKFVIEVHCDVKEHYFFQNFIVNIKMMMTIALSSSTFNYCIQEMLSSQTNVTAAVQSLRFFIANCDANPANISPLIGIVCLNQLMRFVGKSGQWGWRGKVYETCVITAMTELTTVDLDWRNTVIAFMEEFDSWNTIMGNWKKHQSMITHPRSPNPV